jgi:rare lipoprotein A
VGFTAAHRTLPFGTTVPVINVANGKAVVVRNRPWSFMAAVELIDVSRAAARQLDMIGSGTTMVHVERQ